MSEQHHVGLDVSVKETAICIVDPHCKVVHRATVESHPEVIGRYLIDLGHSYPRVGLEAGSLSPWLYAGLVEARLPAICVETRLMHAALSARINKTDHASKWKAHERELTRETRIEKVSRGDVRQHLLL